MELPPQFSADGLRVLLTDDVAHIAEDTNSSTDVYLVMKDQDNDGLPDDWETRSG
jgi:hypothetical protein